MRRFALIPIIFLLAGCAEHRLVVEHPNPTGGEKSAYSTALGFGAVQKRNVADCSTDAIDEVRVKQNFGQALVTVITLGLVMPTHIEYVCANKTPNGPGNIDD